MSEDQKPKWVEKLEKEISDVRIDVNNLTGYVQEINKIGINKKLLAIVELLEIHKNNEAFLMALQGMRGSLDIDKEMEEVRKYAREKGKSVKEAFDEMAEKNILPKGFRDFVKAKKMIREML